MVVATSLMGTAIVLAKKWGRPESPLVMAGWQLTIGGLALVPMTLMGEGLPGSLSARNLLGFAYLGVIGTAAAYALWFRGIDRLTPTSLSLLGLTNPLVATVGGLVVLGQTLTGWQIAGFTLALGALVAGQVAAARRQQPRSQAPSEVPSEASAAVSG